MLADSGFVDIQISQPHDPFGEARGEKKARLFDVYGYTFLARKPEWAQQANRDESLKPA